MAVDKDKEIGSNHDNNEETPSVPETDGDPYDPTPFVGHVSGDVGATLHEKNAQENKDMQVF